MLPKFMQWWWLQVRHSRIQCGLSITALIAFALSVGGGSTLHMLSHQSPLAHSAGNAEQASAAGHRHHCHTHGPHAHNAHAHHHIDEQIDERHEADHSQPGDSQPEHSCPVCLLLASGFTTLDAAAALPHPLTLTGPAPQLSQQHLATLAAHTPQQPRAPPFSA